jgi:hypothetical protein
VPTGKRVSKKILCAYLSVKHIVGAERCFAPTGNAAHISLLRIVGENQPLPTQKRLNELHAVNPPNLDFAGAFRNGGKLV